MEGGINISIRIMQKLAEVIQHFPCGLKQSMDSIDVFKIKKSNLPFKLCCLITYCWAKSLKIQHEHCFSVLLQYFPLELPTVMSGY